MADKRAYELDTVTASDDLSIPVDGSGLGFAGRITVGALFDYVLDQVIAEFSGGVDTSDIEEAVAAAQAAASSAEDAHDEASNEATLAQSYADLAKRYASDPPGTEIIPGVQSALASAMLAASLVNQLAGVPVTDCGSSATRTLLSTDLFGLLVRTNPTCTKLSLVRDVHTTPAVNGSQSVAPVTVFNDAAGDFTIEASATSTVSPAEILQVWQAAPVKNDTQPVAAANVTVNITVPAGAERRVAVVTVDMNDQTASHTVGLTADVGTVTSKLSATAPTGRYSTSPKVNIQGWELALTGTSATAVVLTIAAPANTQSLGYRIIACKNAGSLTITGASNTTAALQRTQPIVVADDGVGAVVFGARNGTNTISITGIANPVSGSNTGSRTSKDLVLAGAQEAKATGTTINAVADYGISDEGATAVAVFTAAAVSATTVTLKGEDVVPSGKSAQLLCLSDGTTYYSAVSA